MILLSNTRITPEDTLKSALTQIEIKNNLLKKEKEKLKKKIYRVFGLEADRETVSKELSRVELFQFCFLYFFCGSQIMSVGPIQTQNSLGRSTEYTLYTWRILVGLSLFLFIP